MNFVFKADNIIYVHENDKALVLWEVARVRNNGFFFGSGLGVVSGILD
ncbi:MAG: hypothetical protein ABIO53_04280 [Chitinophagaceae bacterium]